MGRSVILMWNQQVKSNDKSQNKATFAYLKLGILSLRVVKIMTKYMQSSSVSRIIIYKFGKSGKEYVEAFNFRVQIKKDMKHVKELKETKRYLIFAVISWPFLFSPTCVPTTTPNDGRGEELRRQT